MKREILFRGQRFDNGEWVEGYVIEHFGKSERIFCIDMAKRFDRDGDSLDVFRVDPDTIGQFTGLTDINGFKEFEDDKVKVTWVTPSTGGYLQSDDAWCENEAICTIKYVGNRFVYVRSDGRQLSIRNDAKREVIGTIHDVKEQTINGAQ